MPNVISIGPAIWSSAAATFSAISSFLLWRIHHGNRLDSVRPLILIEDVVLDLDCPGHDHGYGRV